MNGKDKCEFLKSIRKRIAEMNGIEYEPTPCDHEGECMGTCPRCDKETIWLMNELRRKEEAGSPIRIDTDSIEDFENMINDCFDDNDNYELMGMPSLPEPDILRGDIDPSNDEWA